MILSHYKCRKPTNHPAAFENMATKKPSAAAESNVQKMVKRISSRTDSNVSQVHPLKSLQSIPSMTGRGEDGYDGNVQMMVKKISSRTDSDVAPMPAPSSPQNWSSSKPGKREIQDLITQLSAALKEMGGTLRELKRRTDAM